jgi:hypothetical protein
MLQRLQHTPRRLVTAATQWHVTSQQHARRNALVASTTLAQRRLEQQDVEEFFAGLATGRPDVHAEASHTA